MCNCRVIMRDSGDKCGSGGGGGGGGGSGVGVDDDDDDDADDDDADNDDDNHYTNNGDDCYRKEKYMLVTIEIEF
jgi:hypothetical protein